MYTSTRTPWIRGSGVAVAAVGLLLAGACSGSGRTSDPPATSDVATSTTSELPRTTTPTSVAGDDPTPDPTVPTTTTLPPGIAVPIGVRWHEVGLPTTATLSQATRIVATDSGYIVIGKESQTGGGRPAIWTSSDGEVFTLADTVALSPPDNQISLFDAAAINGVAVAVGERSSSCDVLVEEFLSVCYRHSGAAWFSADGQTWEKGDSTDGSFDDGIVTRLTQVLPFGSGFVAAGQVILDRNDWRLGLWTSADGATWTRSALLDDPGGLFGWPSLARAGSTLVTSAMVIRCETPLDVFGGFGFSVPAQNGRAFSSTDGTTWAAIDLGTSGLSRDDGPEACSRNPDGAGFLASGVTKGTVSQVGESVLWTGETGVFVTSDGVTWTGVPDVPDLAEAQDYAVDHVNGRLVGTRPGDLLGLVAGQVVRGYATMKVAAFDGTSWRDWSEHAGGILAFGKSDHYETVGLDDIVKTDDAAILAATVSDDSGTAVRATLYVSRATTFDPTARPTCTPAPAANCADVDLRDIDLHGADLTGIDFRRAALEGVDLSGADLAGALLDDASLETTNISGANLTGASMKRIAASDSTFDGADLSGADATDASFGSSTATIFRDAVLASASWMSGELVNADFRGANLSRAFLFSVDLTGALFQGAAVEDVLWGGSTTCPDGYVLPDFDSDCIDHFIG